MTKEFDAAQVTFMAEAMEGLSQKIAKVTTDELAALNKMNVPDKAMKIIALEGSVRAVGALASAILNGIEDPVLKMDATKTLIEHFIETVAEAVGAQSIQISKEEMEAMIDADDNTQH